MPLYEALYIRAFKNPICVRSDVLLSPARDKYDKMGIFPFYEGIYVRGIGYI